MDKLIKSLVSSVRVIDQLSPGDVFLNIVHYGDSCGVSYSYFEDYDGPVVVGGLVAQSDDLSEALFELSEKTELVLRQFSELTKNKTLVELPIPETFYEFACVDGVVIERQCAYIGIDERQYVKVRHNIGNINGGIIGISLIPIKEIERRYYTDNKNAS